MATDSVWSVAVAVRAIYRSLYILLNNLYGIPTYLMWMLLLRPLLVVRPAWYYLIEGTLFRWLLTMVGSWVWSAGYTVLEVGDDLKECEDDQSLLLINHQSTADVPLLMYSMATKGTVAKSLHWIMDYVFKFTNFGWVSMVHGDFFILQGKETRQLQLTQLRDSLLKSYLPRAKKWIMLFPEGGFLRKRRVNSQKFANKYGFPVLEHVTLPRVGAMQVVSDVLNPGNGISNGGPCTSAAPSEGRGLKWVIDVTIAYPDGRPLDAFCILWGHRAPCQTTIHYRKYPASLVPRDPEGLQRWAYARYEEKERLLAEYYKTGRFPETSPDGATVTNGNARGHPAGGHVVGARREVLSLDLPYLVALNVLFLISTFFHCWLLGQIYAWVWSS